MVYRKRVFIICFLLFFLFSFSTYPHAVYVSVCNIYEKNNSSFFSLRMFKDDIFDALKLRGYSKDLTEKEKKSIVSYVQKNFIVSVNENIKKLNLSRFVFEGSDYTETANIVFVLEGSMSNKNLKVQNTILFDVLEEQTNIVGVKINNTKKTLTFNKNKKENWVQIN